MQKNTLFTLIGLLLILALSSCQTAAKETIAPVDPEVLAEASAVKLRVTQEGLYRVPLKDLGWDENLTGLALTHKGQPIPFELQSSSEEPALIFFGQASSSSYTPDNYYVLTQSAAEKRLITPWEAPAPDPSSQPQAIIHTVHLEENQLYVPKAEGGSPWQWAKIVAPQAHSLEVDPPQLAAGPGQVRASLWGTTTAPTTPDHHVRLWVNGQVVGEVAWDGQAWQLFEAEVPSGVLIEGPNTIEIEATGEVEARLDIINLDWLEIDYPKEGDQIRTQEIFRTPEGSVQLAASKGPLTIYEISNPLEISRLEFPASSENHTFQGNPNHRYLAVTRDGYLSPAQILPLAAEPDLRALTGASYLAIGHPKLLAPLEPLLQARAAQGLSTLSVPLEAIYDQFNGAMPEPEAIQAFLAFAAANWEPAPQYVLLVGDASYDYYGYQTPLEDNFLPTFLVSTVFGGETGSDVRMAQLDTDLTPDVSIGRVPARSVNQIETFVAKTLEYERTSTAASWNRSILAVADGQEASFKADADHFIGQFSEAYQTQIIAPEAGAQGANQQIDAEIAAGKLLTAYFGHGSVNMWGKDSLFTTEDSASLENGSDLSIFLNFTCLTGLFTHPTEESLAESLLFNPNGGAVAVLAPTSPTLPGDQTFLSDALVAGLQQDSLPRLGDITLYAWQQVPTQSPGTTDVMQTFLLFGDPALIVP